MKLPDELFEAVAGCQALCMDRGRRAERRNVGRIRLPARVQVIPVTQSGPGKPVSAQVRDMSQTGIGLLLPSKFSEGDNLIVRLQAKEITAWVFCSIARIERVSEGLYVLGAIFIRLLEPAATPQPARR